MALIPFQDADSIGDEFLSLLSQLQINPPLESEIESELLSLTALIDYMKNPSSASSTNKVEMLRKAAGFHDFAAKVLSARNLSEFSCFAPHLKLLGKKAESFSTLIQNLSAALPNDTNRKLTELYVASLAIHLAYDIKLDSPEAAKGDNPDILFKYCGDPEKGRCWALAIKSVSGASGQTYFERISEAAHQIDAEACPADVGMIVLNIKDTLNHEALWRRPFPDLDSAIKVLNAEIKVRINKTEANRPQTDWDNLFAGKVVRPVIFMAHTLVRIQCSSSQEMPTALKTMVAYDANGEADPVGMEIAIGLNHMMQTVLTGTPGGNGSLPC